MTAIPDALASLLPGPALRAILIVGAMMALFVWGRLRFDLVALLALLAALAAGVVKPEEAFKGFGDDVVLIVASALVISAAITRSGVVEQAARRLAPRLTTLDRQVGALAFLVAALSAVMKNIGALSMLMPVAARLSRRHGSPISRLLMPMAFASLLGGLVTLVGASPNIIVSKIRQDIAGAPFGMFDFTPVGLPLAVAGVALLVLTHRLLGAVALTMTATMAVTPFLNNAATVLVMGPIAAGLAVNLGHRPDPYLMAVAIGAACDFLTPVGHQCNMLVWGPGGYRFGDYWRLGLPLSVLVVALGSPLILLVWPLT